MYGEIDRAGQQRLLDLLREQSLAAGVSERAIHNFVARGADDLDFDCLRCDAAGLGERALRMPPPSTMPTPTPRLPPSALFSPRLAVRAAPPLPVMRALTATL